MRLIVTSETLVEKLKQEAKRLKRKHAGTYAQALDRVARQHGYNHWGHVTWCAKETGFQGKTIAAACEDYIERAMARAEKFDVKEVGPEAPAYVLFSTTGGDAWLVNPPGKVAVCLCWQGERQVFSIDENNAGISVKWSAEYTTTKDFAFAVKSENPKIGSRAIFGYPVAAIDEIGNYFRFSPDVRQLFLGEGAEPLTDTLIHELVGKGWTRERLEQARRHGDVYSRPRNSLLTAPISDGEMPITEED
jgi:hypothetical protein